MDNFEAVLNIFESNLEEFFVELVIAASDDQISEDDLDSLSTWPRKVFEMRKCFFETIVAEGYREAELKAICMAEEVATELLKGQEA